MPDLVYFSFAVLLIWFMFNKKKMWLRHPPASLIFHSILVFCLHFHDYSWRHAAQKQIVLNQKSIH